MSDLSSLVPEEAARQVRLHLDSLRDAGITWLPAAPLVARAAAASTPIVTGVTGTKQFPDASGLALSAPVSQANSGGLESTLSPERRCHELRVLAEQVS